MNARYGEDRLRKFRDASALVAVIGPLVMGAGVIGKWYVDCHRINELEKRLDKLSIRVEKNQDIIQQLAVEIAERTARLRRNGPRHESD